MVLFQNTKSKTKKKIDKEPRNDNLFYTEFHIHVSENYGFNPRYKEIIFNKF